MVYTGKYFEKDFIESFEGNVHQDRFMRLYDPTGGFKGVANICDFVAHYSNQTFLFELKTTKLGRLDLDMLTDTQFSGMLKKTAYKNYRCGVLVFLREKNESIYYLPIEEIALVREGGAKSVSYEQIKKNGVEIKYTKKRVRVKLDPEDFFPTLSTFYKHWDSKES